MSLLLATVALGRSSDSFSERGYHLSITVAIGMIGYLPSLHSRGNYSSPLYRLISLHHKNIDAQQKHQSARHS